MFRWKISPDGIHTGLTALIIAELLALLLSPLVSTALIAFCVSGKVPGTNLFLSPEETMQLVMATSAFAVAAIFSSEIAQVTTKISNKILFWRLHLSNTKQLLDL